MTTPGWIIMLLSVGGVTVLFVWCLYRVFTSAPPERLETRDTQDDDTSV